MNLSLFMIVLVAVYNAESFRHGPNRFLYPSYPQQPTDFYNLFYLNPPSYIYNQPDTVSVANDGEGGEGGEGEVVGGKEGKGGDGGSIIYNSAPQEGGFFKHGYKNILQNYIDVDTSLTAKRTDDYVARMIKDQYFRPEQAYFDYAGYYQEY